MFFRLTPILKVLLISNIFIYILNNLLFEFIFIYGVPLKNWIIDIFALQPIYNSYSEIGFGIWQLITYQFLHNDFGHLFFNMFALFMFSFELEKNWGSVKFLTIYLLSGIGAGILHLFVTYLLGQFAPTIGASGSLYGIILAFAMSNPDRKIFMFPIFIPIPAKIFGIGMMVISMVIGITSAGGDGIAHFAHFGGALTGLLLYKYGEKTQIFNFLRRKFHFGIAGDENLYNSNDNNTFFRKFERKRSRNTNEYNNFQNITQDEYKVEWINPNNDDELKTTYNTNNYNKINNLEIDGIKISQETIDNILDKIANDGYKSLTEQEKYILTTITKLL